MGQLGFWDWQAFITYRILVENVHGLEYEMYPYKYKLTASLLQRWHGGCSEDKKIKNPYPVPMYFIVHIYVLNPSLDGPKR